MTLEQTQILSGRKRYKYREVLKKLKKFDSRFEEHVRKGKGSHRLIYHPDIDGEPKSYPLKCHGENTELGYQYLEGIVRRFNLPKDFF